MRREKYPAFIVVGASFFLSFIHCPWFSIFYDDKEIFKYAGRVIMDGGVPYRDFFDHKPPLIFFLNYAGLLLGPWGLWLLDSLLILCSSLVFFRTCKRNLAHSWLLPVLFNLMIRIPYTSNGIGMTREYTTILVLLFFSVMLCTRKYKFIELGLISGLIFFMQQDQLLTLLPFLIYAAVSGIHSPWSTQLFKRIAALAAGFAILCIPLLAYFMAHYALLEFWKDAFLFNLEWYAEKTGFIYHLRPIMKTMQEAGYDLPFYVSVTLGLASLILGNKKKFLMISALLSVFLSFSAEYISGKLIFGLAVSYYLLPLAATLPILLFTVFAFSKTPLFLQKPQQMIYGIIFSIPLLLRIVAYSSNLLPLKSNWFESTAEKAYFENLKIRNFDLYIFNSSNAVFLYNQHKILAPSKWIYHYFWHWYKNWDPHHEILQSITDDLMRHKTTYVLDYSDSTTFKNKDNYQYWKGFLENHYASTRLDSGRVQVWKMK